MLICISLYIGRSSDDTLWYVIGHIDKNKMIILKKGIIERFVLMKVKRALL